MLCCLINDKNKESPLITVENPTKEYLTKMNSGFWGVYFTVNTFEASEEEIKKTNVETKRNECFLKKLRYVFGDLDVAKRGDRQSREEKQNKKKILLQKILEKIMPTYVIETSNGLQPLWELKTTEVNDETKEKYRGIISGIIEWSKDVGAMGDNVKHLTQILRLPGFFHHKEEPFLVKFCHEAPETSYTLDELKTVFYLEQKKYEPMNVNFEKNGLILEVDKIDFRTLITKSFNSIGRQVEFDKAGRLVIDGRLTGTFQGKKGNRDYLASSSHEPFKGNRVTAVADILGVTTKEAWKWILGEFNISLSKIAAEKAKEKIKEITSVKTKKLEKFYTWGTKELTETFAPIKRNSSIVLVGETGDGKSTLAFDLAIKNAELGHRVLYLSLEMTAEELRENIARNYCGMTIAEEIYQQVPSHKQKAFERKMAELKAIQNLDVKGIVGNESVNWAMVAEFMKGGYDLVILDNLDLIQGDEREHELDRQKRISKNILNYCSLEQVPIILLHHYNKMSGGARSIHNISGSAKISHNAHRIVMLRRKKAVKDKETGVWSVLSEKEKAVLYLTLEKARGYDKAFKIVYFYKGTFYDNYPPDEDKTDVTDKLSDLAWWA